MARFRAAAGGALLALAVAFASFTSPAHARFVVEKSAIRVKLPAGAHPRPIAMSLANFGAPLYGGSLMCVFVVVSSFFLPCGVACRDGWPAQRV
jgi:hypothetical protein